MPQTPTNNKYYVGEVPRITNGGTVGGKIVGSPFVDETTLLAVDPTTVKFACLKPNGTLVQHTYGDGQLTHSGAAGSGIYQVDLPLDVEGPYSYTLFSTGTGQAADMNVLIAVANPLLF